MESAMSQQDVDRLLDEADITSANNSINNVNTPTSPLLNHNNNSSASNRQHPGAVLLSPPGSRYAFEPTDPATSLAGLSSPLLDVQRPFSAQGAGGVPAAIPERPLSSMEIDSLTFKNDVANLVNWLGTLNANQHRTVVDNWLANLPQDIVLYAKQKLDQDSQFHHHHHHPHNHNHHHHHNQEAYQHHQQQLHQPIASPAPLYQQSSLQEPLTLDSVLNGENTQSVGQTPWSPPTAATNLQRALSPNFTSLDRSALLQDISFNRPRSADPYQSKLLSKSSLQDLNKTPSKSRTSNRFEHSITNSENNYPYQPQQQHQQHQQQQQQQQGFDITNLAQQLASNPIPLGDYNSNALKLSALSTINNRAQLDSNKKKQQQQLQQQQFDERGRTSAYQNNMNIHNPLSPPLQKQQYQYDDLYNNRIASSSLPPPQRVNYYDSLGHTANNSKNKKNRTIEDMAKMASLNSATKNLSINNEEITTPIKQSPQSPSSSTKSPAINPKQITNPKLLNDIPAWLKTLRLHKYTSCLQDLNWKDLIYFSDEQLEAQGVSAMGARGKLLKAFQVVRQHYEEGLIKD